jgi:hypothetical protein
MSVQDIPSVDVFASCGQTIVIIHGGLLWQDCGLEAGHAGPCMPKGHCIRHGDFYGPSCPHWPTCFGPSEVQRRKLLGEVSA